MSELKVYVKPLKANMLGETIVGQSYYLKSEADKVIAEKDAEIVELKKQVHDYAQGLYVIQARAEKEARHHKYKRCLAMARWCASRSASWCLDPADEQLHKSEFYDKWKHRWLSLADKFKEAK